MSRFLWFVGLFWTVIPLLSAGTLNVTFNSIPEGSVINLTTNGVLDWVHWGLFTETSIDRKGGVTPLISDFAPVDASNGFVYVYQFDDNANGYSWSDGTPHMAVTNTTTGVWAYGTPAVGSGFRISVPAGTNLQTLKVYVGAFAARGRFAAELSDQSAPGYTNPANAAVSNLGNGPSGVYSINFAADAPGETLTVTYTLETPRGDAANVTLQAAALTSPGANNVPFVTLTSPAEGTSVVTPTNILLSAIASDVDGTISSVEFLDGTNSIGSVTNAPYELIWTDPPPGKHIITARAVDDVGAIGTSTPATIFVAGGGGTISGARGPSPTALDLTAEGTSDWAHWGLRSAVDFNHKSTGASQISNFTRIGTNTVQRYTDNRTAFSWSDGTPVAAVANTNTGVYINGLTNGFEFTVPADTNMRTLRVYAGLYGAQGNFQAWLTDFSGQAYTDTSLSNVFGNSYVFYTLNYAAASSNQSLVVRYTSQNVFDYDFGNITLQCATLEGLVTVSTNVPPVVTITNPTNGAAFPALSSITIEANASDSDGSVTNVEFYAGATFLGADSVAPFSITVSNLAAGSYALMARAFDDSGASADSAPANITVSSNTPVAARIVNPRLAEGAFLFSFDTQPGAAYAVEFTTSLAPIDWHVLTNFVAIGSSATVTNPISGAQQFYRVRSD